MFDVKLLFENEGFTEDIKEGLLLSILSSNRPIHELLSPNLIDQSKALVNQFEGMSITPFTYVEYEATRRMLIQTIHENLNTVDRQFLLSLKDLNPDWKVYGFERFPSVQWKILNLQRLKDTNSKKHRKYYNTLKKLLKE